MSHRPDPEMNSVHSVKILLCYILDKLNRTVTEEQLRLISEDSGVISYFFFSDALEELIANGSVEVTEEDGSTVSFRLRDGNTELISMSFYAPDHSQAELISEKIKANPMGAYKNILEYLLNNQAEKIDVEKYL